MWKGRKDVTITYSQIGDNPISETFNDEIQFVLTEKSNLLSKPVKLEGVDTVQPLKSDEDGRTTNGVRFTWKGKGLLKVAGRPSWQVLGFFLASDPQRQDEDWVVTYYGKTLVSSCRAAWRPEVI